MKTSKLSLNKLAGEMMMMLRKNSPYLTGVKASQNMAAETAVAVEEIGGPMIITEVVVVAAIM